MEKPKVNDEGIYVDEEGRVWTTFLNESHRLKVDAGTISNNLPETAATIEGCNRGNSPTVLHLRDDIEKAVAHLTAVPCSRNVRQNPVYTTSDGRHYASAPIAARLFNMSDSTIRKRKKDVRRLKGRDQQGVVDLVCIDELKKDPTIKARIEGQIRVDKNGYYTDPDGVMWATINAFFSSLSKDIKAKTDKSSVWMQAKKHCRSLKATDRCGRANAEIFPVEELKTKALTLANEPFRVDRQTKYYSEKDAEGNEIMRWATKNAWLDLLKVTRYALEQGLKNTYKTWENVPRHKGLSEIGRPDWLYSKATMREILAYIFEAEIQSEKGVYIQQIIDETRGAIGKKVYKSAIRLTDEVPVTAENIKKRLLRAGCPTITAIDRHHGGKEVLFDYERFKQIFGEQVRVILNSDSNGEITDRNYGRCITVEHFCTENPGISRQTLDRKLKIKHPVRFRRRDPRNHRLENLYPEKGLKALVNASSQ